jgi:hypothetical protein
MTRVAAQDVASAHGDAWVRVVVDEQLAFCSELSIVGRTMAVA